MEQPAEAFFDQYHLAVYRYFLRVTGQPDTAQDLTQELFLRVVRGISTFKSTGKDAAWIFRIARHLAVDHRQQQARRAETQLSEAAAVTRESTQLVAFGLTEALALLTDAEREAFLWREVVGLGYTEMAVVCESTPEAMWGRVSRARIRLKELLGSRLSARGKKRGSSSE